MSSDSKVRKCYWLFVVIGSLIVGIAGGSLNPENSFGFKFTVSWLIFILVLLFFINYRSIKKLSEITEELNNNLYRDLDSEKYISEIEKLYKNKKTAYLKGIKYINLASAYCLERNYEHARDLYLKVNVKKLDPANKITYFADLAFVYFNLGANEKAIEIIEKNHLFEIELPKSDQLESLIEILKVYVEIEKDDFENAKLLYDVSRAKYENNYNSHDFNVLHEMIELNKNEYL